MDWGQGGVDTWKFFAPPIFPPWEPAERRMQLARLKMAKRPKFGIEEGEPFIMPQNRRTFLKASALATASFALPNMIPRSWARGNAGPNNRINLGLIGCGKISWGHRTTILATPEVQLTCICDVDNGRRATLHGMAREAYASRQGTVSYSGIKSFRDFRELLEEPGLDAVLIATPDHWHAVIAIAAMRKGLDVYCEKPLALTVEEGRAIVNTAKRYGTVFQVGSQQRSDRSFRHAAQLARSGYLGELKEIYTSIRTHRGRFCSLPAERVPEGLDWDMWIGPSPWRPYSSELSPDGEGKNYAWSKWREYLNYGEGYLTDWTPHHPDIAAWALDYDESGPDQVLFSRSKEGPELTYIWPHGVPMMLKKPKLEYHPEEEGSIFFIGTDGTAIAARGDYLKTYPEHLASISFKPGDDLLYISNDHFGNWIDCIRTRRACVCPPEAGHRSASLGHIGNLALRFERDIRWDAQAERYLGDAYLNRFLSRSLRSPWTL